MRRTILGARIRERRRNLGITQADLARTLAISASYLNLIEHNKRGIAGDLLRRAAEALSLPIEALDGAAERRLLETLEELAHLPDVAALGVEADNAGELIGRFPGWARAIAALAHSEREATENARVLADRLTHDPFLGDAMHRMLTRIAAIRSAGEILVEHDDLDTQTRERFHDIINDESGRLSEVGEALASYFDQAETAQRTLTPLDEVESMFEARENRFEEIEAAVEPLAERLTEALPGPRREAAQALAHEHLLPVIETITTAMAGSLTTLARTRAHDALLVYATEALLAPMQGFAPRAKALGYDIDALAEHFSVGIRTVCHRLTAIPAAPDTPRFGYFRANAAGTVIETRNLTGLTAPRYASACPLWVLYRAQQSPEATIRQRAVFASGERFIFVARARSTGPTGFGQPRHYVTDMVTMTEACAQHTVYAPDSAVPIEAIGSGCRSCPRDGCEHRVADPLAG